MTNRRTMALAAAAACLLGSGCSAQLASSPTPSPSPTPSQSHASTAKSAQLKRQADLLTSDDLGPMTDVVWREDSNYDPKQVGISDEAVPVGSYELQVACTAGAVKVAVDHGPPRQFPCTGALGPGLSVCVTKRGLFATLDRIPGPVGDAVWQLRKADPGRCKR